MLGFTLKKTSGEIGEAGPFIQILVNTRRQLRAQKLFEMADGIRGQLEDQGIILEDGPGGTTWRMKS